MTGIGLRSLFRYELAVYALNHVADAMHNGIIDAAVRKACIEERDRLARDAAEAKYALGLLITEAHRATKDPHTREVKP